MSSITASNGVSAKVSPEDLAELSKYRWHALPKTRGEGFYLYAQVNRRTVYMHRIVAHAPDGKQVDHINGDPSDNRRENLRLATQSENNANRASYKPKSGFRGVYAQPHGHTWQVKISVGGKIVRGGSFADPVEAARRYDRLAREHYGEFATINFQTENA